MRTFHDIENALKDYHWMVKEIARLREELNTTNASLTAAYGIEATLPKGNDTSDPTGRECLQRDRKHRTLKKFEDKVSFIEKSANKISDDRELTVFNCLLDGMSIPAISQHMGFSEKRVYKIKDDIVGSLREKA